MKDQLHLTRETILQSFMKIWRKGNIWAKLFFIQFHGRAIVTICEGLIRTFYTSLHSHNSIVTWDEPWVDQRQTRTKVRAGRGEQYHHRGPQISPWIKMILTNPFLKKRGVVRTEFALQRNRVKSAFYSQVLDSLLKREFWFSLLDNSFAHCATCCSVYWRIAVSLIAGHLNHLTSPQTNIFY